MTFLETWIVYPIPPRDRCDWNPTGFSREDVHFAAADGTQLFGWFVPHPEPKFAVLYCHGNGEQVADNADLMCFLRDELQASLLVFDYRGYGHSIGTPCESGLIADGRAAQRWLAKRMGIEPRDVVLMGRSIGGGVAVALAAENGARALVLENTFSRITDVAARVFRWLPVHLLMRNRFDSIDRIQHYQGPLFQSHAAADEIVPFDLGRRLFETSPSKAKLFVDLPHLGHNDFPPRGYYRQLAEFLNRYAGNAAK
jgi:fermentation-respiration switch protein FrsA (DUF1100 family)